MTVTLDLPAESERELIERAREAGQSVPEFMLRALASVGVNVGQPKPKRQLRGYGIAAHLGVSCEDVHRQHQEEIERDAEREQRWQGA